MAVIDENQIVRPAELAKLLGISKATLFRWTKEGVLPPRRKLGPNVSFFFRGELDRWLESRPKLQSKAVAVSSDLTSPEPTEVPAAD